MALQLYMIGLVAQDMRKSLDFYRQLGLDIPEGSEGEQHVEVKMGDMVFFLDTRSVRRENPGQVEGLSDYRIVFEYKLPSQAAVDAKYSELTSLGHESYRAPFVTNFGMYFALVSDPDGNTVLLSAELES